MGAPGSEVWRETQKEGKPALRLRGNKYVKFGGFMVMKRFVLVDWLGGPDRKNGKTVWRKGHWRT